MTQIRRANERGRSQLDWLDSWHSFSFADYHDPNHMGVSNLRVINDDTVAPTGGFATHGHRDMEIVTYVLDGALEHKDSMGNGSVIRPGDVQRMSAGSGVRHSEYNPSPDQPVRLLQIWLTPNQLAVTPSYEQKHFPEAERRGRLRLLVSPDGRDGSVASHQDALLYGSLLAAGEQTEMELGAGRTGYILIAKGRALVNGESLGEGDAISIEGQTRIGLQGVDQTELLVFDLP
jgi:redox-sensitive bicupin YhaK (pirin superfamily)